MKREIITFVFIALVSTIFAQQKFTEGNLVVYRFGDGTDTYDVTAKKAAPIFLDEYQVSGTSALLIQSIAMPTVSSGTNKRMVSAGQALTEGYISRSADGQFIVVSGYDNDFNTSIPSTSSRVAALVDYSGKINSSTYCDSPNGAFRSITSYDGTAFWLSGSGTGDINKGGVSYIPLGGTEAVNLGTRNNSTRQLKFYNGNLYAVGINYIHQVGTKKPIDAESALPFENLTPEPAFSDCYNFFIVNVSTDKAVKKEIAYVVDAAAGIIKYVFNGGVWVESGYYGNDDTKGFRGIEGKLESDGRVRLYIVKSTGTESSLLTLKDNGGFSEDIITDGITVLINFAATNKAVRSLAWAPVEKSITSTLQVNEGQVKVYKGGGKICIHTSESMKVSIYNNLGVKVKEQRINSGINTIGDLTAKGLYFVKVGNEVTKVIL